MTLEDGYRNWLERKGYVLSTTRDEISQLRRVELHFGDIAGIVAAGGFDRLIEQLTYSVEDERTGRDNPTPIPINGNLRTNLATYKKTARLYATYLQDRAEGGA